MEYDIELALRFLGEQTYELSLLKREVAERDEEIRELNALVDRLRGTETLRNAET